MAIKNLPIRPLEFDEVIILHKTQTGYARQYAQYGMQSLSMNNLFSKMAGGHHCHYCTSDLVSADKLVSLADVDHTDTDYASWYEICQACGYWRYQQTSGIGATSTTVPIAKKFDSGISIPALNELSKYIRRDPGKVFALDYKTFEILVGSILRDFLKCEVYHVGRTGDGGVDLIAVKGETTKLVQVKRRLSEDSYEGVETIRSLFASTLLERGTDAMVVTSAKRFTRGAAETANLINDRYRKFDMSLVAMADLLDMIDASVDTCDPHPYLKFKNRPDSGTWFLHDAEVLSVESELGVIIECVIEGVIRYYTLLAEDVTNLNEYEVQERVEIYDQPLDSVVSTLNKVRTSLRYIAMDFGVERNHLPMAVTDLIENYVQKRSGHGFSVVSY